MRGRKISKTIIAILIFLLVSGGAWYYFKWRAQSEEKVQYTTATVQKGTLIISVSGSGTVLAPESVAITASISGVINKVYVKNGDTVEKGQKIAEVTLDAGSLAKKTTAYVSYLNAVNAQTSAEQNKLSLEAQVLKDQQSVLEAQNNVDYKNNNSVNPATKADYTDLEKQSIDLALMQAQKSLELSQQKYQNADAVITSAKAQVSSAWFSYQETLPTLIVPAAGVIHNLNISPGSIIGGSSQNTNSSASSSSSIELGTIMAPGQLIKASITLSEINVLSVKPAQKVTLTLDAYPEKTFTGKVLSVDTNGQVSSGVTSYPVKLIFDPTDDAIYSNMAVTANIIVSVKDDVILVPSSAVQTVSGQSIVQVMENNQVESIPVEVGDSNDTQTEIVSGINEGDTVVTATISATSTSSSSQNSGSPFGSFGGSRIVGGGGGGPVFEFGR